MPHTRSTRFFGLDAVEAILFVVIVFLSILLVAVSCHILWWLIAERTVPKFPEIYVPLLLAPTILVIARYVFGFRYWRIRPRLLLSVSGVMGWVAAWYVIVGTIDYIGGVNSNDLGWMLLLSPVWLVVIAVLTTLLAGGLILSYLALFPPAKWSTPIQLYSPRSNSSVST